MIFLVYLVVLLVHVLNLAHGESIVRFNYTGSLQYYTVPLGYPYVIVQAYGAGAQSGGGCVGGKGGQVQAVLQVTEGTVLNVYVGGQGIWGSCNPGGWNGGGQGSGGCLNWGGGGGGCSDIRVGGTSMINRIIVAGGGGGAGNYVNRAGNGGDGGYPSGGTGSPGVSSYYNGDVCATGWTVSGGSQTSGGTGKSWNTGQVAQPGTQGQGGTVTGGSCGGGFGAGGGCGYWGGQANANNGGGGGGSSWVSSTYAYGTTATYSTGVNVGNGYVMIQPVVVPPVPSAAPTNPTPFPTIIPTVIPTVSPSTIPSPVPTVNPTVPTTLPTHKPTNPTPKPTAFPSGAPLSVTRFNYTGSLQYYTVPLGYPYVIVEAYGAGAQSGGGCVGGKGGQVQAVLQVTEGTVLNVYVGGQGIWGSCNPGGWNGGGQGSGGCLNWGGGGGGCSDIRVGGTSMINRIIVAGGGGGAGNYVNSAGNGGDGGYPSGGTGSPGVSSYYNGDVCATGWTVSGGSQTSGGTGMSWNTGQVAQPGTQGQGGTVTGGSCGGGFGAGGGCGYWGGQANANNGGGGGGSSWVSSTYAYGTTATYSTGVNVGNGYVMIQPVVVPPVPSAAPSRNIEPTAEPTAEPTPRPTAGPTANSDGGDIGSACPSNSYLSSGDSIGHSAGNCVCKRGFTPSLQAPTHCSPCPYGESTVYDGSSECVSMYTVTVASEKRCFGYSSIRNLLPLGSVSIKYMSTSEEKMLVFTGLTKKFFDAVSTIEARFVFTHRKEIVRGDSFSGVLTKKDDIVVQRFFLAVPPYFGKTFFHLSFPSCAEHLLKPGQYISKLRLKFYSVEAEAMLTADKIVACMDYHLDPDSAFNVSSGVCTANPHHFSL